jgi:hypothetical protein
VGAVASSTAIAHRLRVIDTTNIQEPGSTGTDLRLHYSNRRPTWIGGRMAPVRTAIP